MKTKNKLGYIGFDQYGQTYKLTTNYPRKELINYYNLTGRVSKMYRDTESGAKHVGYVIGQLWISLFEIHEFKK